MKRAAAMYKKRIRDKLRAREHAEAANVPVVPGGAIDSPEAAVALADRIGAEVRRSVTDQYERAKRILSERRELLDRIADALLEYETLDAADIDVLMGGGAISRPPPPKPLQTAVVEKKKAGLIDAAAGPVPAAGKA